MAETAPQSASAAGLRIVLDYGPLIVFFATNAIASGTTLERVLKATLAFMIAMTIALVMSWWKLRRISPMLLITGVFVLIFGGLTLYFHDRFYIQVKPTFVYAMFAAILGYGLVTNKPLLQMMLGSAYPGLSPHGWRLLTINWSLFFVAMAIANEITRHVLTWNHWMLFKTRGVIPLTLVFAMLNIPMLLRHGLQLDKPGDAPVPPEG